MFDVVPENNNTKIVNNEAAIKYYCGFIIYFRVIETLIYGHCVFVIKFMS